MEKIFLLGLLSLIFLLIFPLKVKAVYDPMSVPNNRYGIHILNPEEINKAVELVNSNGGEWGYVTVPIRGDDRDRVKWKRFFEQCRELKVIPMLRLATFGRGETWVLPTEEEMLDFANFLNELPWPVKNRYVIVFNEINHSKEWGGFVDPEAYAEILSYTIEIFKSRHEDFFVLPAGLDMAAPNNHTSLNAYNYWKRVFKVDPELVQKIDGWNSHAYPNPDFSGRPSDVHPLSITSYRHDLVFLKQLGREKIPVFITETGWRQDEISPETVKKFWKEAYEQVWTESEIVAITPFVLQASDGEFKKFSFLNQDNSLTGAGYALKEVQKKVGEPQIAEVQERREALNASQPEGGVSTTSQQNWQEPLIDLQSLLEQVRVTIKKWVTHSPTLIVGETEVKVELADTPEKITLGLGHRPSMPENQGMLFVFEQSGMPGFWMKHTLFPLDIIWIRDGKVVDITEKMPMASDPANPKVLYYPKSEVDQVLEVNAGWVERQGVRIGDEVEYDL